MLRNKPGRPTGAGQCAVGKGRKGVIPLNSDEQADRLVAAAVSAAGNAYAPYSGFKVGAALMVSGGQIFTGCNVENASYGCTLCAERAAVAAAIAAGFMEFTAIAIAGGDDYCYPCGVCRQVLWEFGNIQVLAADRNGRYVKTTLDQLFPFPFVKN